LRASVAAADTRMPTPPQLLPLRAYFRETLAFLSSHSYLLVAEIASMKDAGSDLGASRADLCEKLPEMYGNPVEFLLARMFISQIASFEVLLQDTAALVVRKDPKKVGSTKFSLAEIIDADSSSALIDTAIDQYLNSLMYQKPSAYLEGLCSILSIDANPLRNRWKEFVEAKARRDLGVHGAWRCNAVYLRKLKEADITSTATVGDSMWPPYDGYLDTTMDTLNSLAMEITARVSAVHWPDIRMEDLDVST
jgi:hypothetical protein